MSETTNEEREGEPEERPEESDIPEAASADDATPLEGEAAEPEGPTLSIDPRDAKIGAGIFLLAILAFLPSLLGGYIWDDSGITNNPLIRSDDGWIKIWTSPTGHVAERHYWPVVYTSFWLESYFFGLSPVISHLINLLLHAANAVLVWLVARRLGLPGAALAGAIFAAHPSHAESVAWVIERKDLLSAFFYLAALASFLGFERGRKSPAYVAVIAFFALALLSKSIALSLPIAIALAIWARPEKASKETVLLIVPLALVAVVLTAIDLAVSKNFGPPSAPEMTLGDRILVPARAVFFYLSKLAWPGHQMPIYPRWDLEEPGALAFYYPILLGAAAAALWGARKAWGRAPIALAAFYVATLAPALGFLRHDFMRLSFVADRHQYLASAGPIALAAAVAALMIGRLSGPARRAGIAAVGAGVAALAAIAWTQTIPFQNEERFWARAASLNPRSAEVAINRGFALKRDGKAEEAAAQFERASLLDPTLGLAGIALAQAYTDLGRFEEATKLCEEALKRTPDSETALMTMGNLLSAQGRAEEAVKYFEKALGSKPESSALRINMGLSMAEKGSPDAAIDQFKKVLAADPGNVKALFEVAHAAQLKGDLKTAMDYYLQALQIEPLHVEALVNLGAVSAQVGRGSDALLLLQRALELEPGNAEAHMNLGVVFGGAGDSDKAIAEYQKALELKPDYPDALNNLGIEYGIKGNAAKAEECFRKAMDGHPTHAPSRNSLGILRAQQGKLEEALALFEEAARIDPNNAESANYVKRIRSQMEALKAASPTPAP